MYARWSLWLVTGSSEGLVSFRSADASDTPAICELWDLAGLGGGRGVDEAEIAERLKEDDGFFVVGEAAHDAAIVAVAMGCYDNHRGWMKRIAIHPDVRGRGLGRELVAEVEQRFADAGVTHLRLAVWSDNPGAATFWEQLGYIEEPEIRYFTKGN